MPDTGEPFRGREHILAVAFAGNLVIAPMHLDRLLVVSLDCRDPHPNVGIASRGIPTLDLVSQWVAIGGEADVLASGLRLAEIERVPVKTDQQREVFFQG